MKKGIALVLVTVVCLWIGGNADAQERWNLQFEPVKLDRISIKTGMQWNAYWYMIYRVTNKTEETVPLNLSIKATSDVAKRTYLQGYYKRVEEAVEKRMGKPYLNIRDMRSEIGPGETREAIAVFGRVAEATDTLTIQVLGLWDRVLVKGGKTFIEDKALVLTFSRPGDEYYPQYDKIRLARRTWIVLFSKEWGQ